MRRDQHLDVELLQRRLAIQRALISVELASDAHQSFRIFTTTLIASSTRSRAYRSAVGSSPSGNVWVWISFASNRFCAISAAARWVALLPSPRIPKT